MLNSTELSVNYILYGINFRAIGLKNVEYIVLTRKIEENEGHRGHGKGQL